MSAGRFLFNVPASALRALVEAADAAGGPYPDEAAVADLQLTADAGRVYGQRTYAERWGWSYPTVRYRWPQLTAEAARRATSDGRQLDNPAARDVPAGWLENAGLTPPDRAGNGADGGTGADPQRTAADDDYGQRTPQRITSAPDRAGNGPNGAEITDPQRTQPRTDSAPHRADPPSRIPHPTHPPTLTPPRVDRPDPASRDGSVGPRASSSAAENGFVADAARRLRAVGEGDEHAERKVAALADRYGRPLVASVLADLEAQTATVRSPLGWLTSQLRKSTLGRHRSVAGHGDGAAGSVADLVPLVPSVPAPPTRPKAGGRAGRGDGGHDVPIDDPYSGVAQLRRGWSEQHGTYRYDRARLLHTTHPDFDGLEFEGGAFRAVVTERGALFVLAEQFLDRAEELREWLVGAEGRPAGHHFAPGELVVWTTSSGRRGGRTRLGTVLDVGPNNRINVERLRDGSRDTVSRTMNAVALVAHVPQARALVTPTAPSAAASA